MRLRRERKQALTSGRDLRDARLRCGRELRDVAAELRVPPGDLRAIEWDRRDLLRSPRYSDWLVRRYEEWFTPDGVPRPVRLETGLGDG